MSKPIVLISNHLFKEGKLDEYRQSIAKGTPLIEETKPATVAFLAYLNEEGTEGSIVHVSPDEKSMELHVRGAAERGKAVADSMEVDSIIIYGGPSDAVLESMKRAAGSGIGLVIKPESLGGFLRLESE